MPSSPINDCLMLILSSASAASAQPIYACASVFPSTADAAHTSFLKRKRCDMLHYASTSHNALCFFASSSSTASKCDTDDYETLKQIAAATKFKRQRAISIPLFSRRCDSFFTAFQIVPFHSSDLTFSFRSDLRYVPTLRTFLFYKCFFYSGFRGSRAPV